MGLFVLSQCNGRLGEGEASNCPSQRTLGEMRKGDGAGGRALGTCKDFCAFTFPFLSLQMVQEGGCMFLTIVFEHVGLTSQRGKYNC